MRVSIRSRDHRPASVKAAGLFKRPLSLPLPRLPRWPLEQVRVFIALGLVLMIFIAASRPFSSMDNFMLIALDASIIGIVAAGQTLVLLTGGIDLSVGSVVAFAGVLAASLMQGLAGLPPLPGPLAIAIAVLLGALVGGLQGWLIARRGMPPFIVTLAVMIVLRGTTQAYINSAPARLHSLPLSMKWLSEGYVGPLPVPVLIMLGIYCGVAYLLSRRKLGRYYYSIGNSETAARLSGVNVDRYKISVYVASGALAAIAGSLLIFRINGAFSTNGENYELSSIAAAVIGGTSLSGGIGGIWGTLGGVMLMATTNNGMTMLNVAPEWQKVVIGSMILLAMAIDMRRWRSRKSALKASAQPLMVGKFYLGAVLNRLLGLLEDRFGCRYWRVYLLDRGSNELVQQLADPAGDDAQPGRRMAVDAAAGRRVSAAQSAELPAGRRVASNAQEGDVHEGDVHEGDVHEGDIPAGRRASGDARSARQPAESVPSMVLHARENNAPVYLPDITRAAPLEVRPLLAYAKSAVALPLRVRGEVIGVLEVQSVVADGFDEAAIDALDELGQDIASLLEDAWLLESGWLVQQLRETLRHLWDDLYLGRSALARWWLAAGDLQVKTTPAARGEMLRSFLLSLMEKLYPHDAAEQARGMRGQRILWLTYVDGQTVAEITRELHISRRQYFYDLKAALDALADLLVQEHQASQL